MSETRLRAVPQALSASLLIQVPLDFAPHWLGHAVSFRNLSVFLAVGPQVHATTPRFFTWVLGVQLKSSWSWEWRFLLFWKSLIHSAFSWDLTAVLFMHRSWTKREPPNACKILDISISFPFFFCFCSFVHLFTWSHDLSMLSWSSTGKQPDWLWTHEEILASASWVPGLESFPIPPWKQLLCELCGFQTFPVSNQSRWCRTLGMLLFLMVASVPLDVPALTFAWQNVRNKLWSNYLGSLWSRLYEGLTMKASYLRAFEYLTCFSVFYSVTDPVSFFFLAARKLSIKFLIQLGWLWKTDYLKFAMSWIVQ